jgi:leucyl aminopeptidase
LDIPSHPRLAARGAAAVPLTLLTDAEFPAWLGRQPDATAAWLRAQAFRPERNRVLCLPDATGRCDAAIVGLGAAPPDLWCAAAMADRLPSGCYALTEPIPPQAATLFVIGWLLGSYRYTRYRRNADAGAAQATLCIPEGADVPLAIAMAAAVGLARDLINTPANDLGPSELEAAARSVAAAAGGNVTVIGDVALAAGFPLIEAVGRGSPRAARLIDLRFPRPGAPRVTLVGKGVCFDSGGLDIKPSAGMLLMKKDMGGAACALSLAQLLRARDAPIELRVLIPAVENSVDGASFRPGDVLASRRGLTVEIGNTDAEGRLVLADALTLAGEEHPDLLIDLATLTGAARVALGPELPAGFSGDPKLLDELARQGEATADPIWPLPLWAPYDEDLASRIADVNNAGGNGFAGAITAALFLRRFVAEPSRWLHLDLYGWNPKERPGRPVGAEGQCIRALYGLIRQRFG